MLGYTLTVVCLVVLFLELIRTMIKYFRQRPALNTRIDISLEAGEFSEGLPQNANLPKTRRNSPVLQPNNIPDADRTAEIPPARTSNDNQSHPQIFTTVVPSYDARLDARIFKTVLPPLSREKYGIEAQNYQKRKDKDHTAMKNSL